MKKKRLGILLVCTVNAIFCCVYLLCVFSLMTYCTSWWLSNSNTNKLLSVGFKCVITAVEKYMHLFLNWVKKKKTQFSIITLFFVVFKLNYITAYYEAERPAQWDHYKLPMTTDTFKVKKWRYTDWTVVSCFKLPNRQKMQFMCVLKARSLLVSGKKTCHNRKRMCQLERSQLSIENKWSR